MELLYRLLLFAYPRRFRAEYGVLMLEMFRVQRRRAGRDPRRLGAARFWLFAVDDLIRNAAAERGSRLTGTSHPLIARPPGRGPLPLDRFDMMQTLLAEIRHAVRRLAQAPMFTATAVLITALGIGANSAIFTFVDATLLRPASFDRPDQVVSVYQDSDDGEPNSSSFPAYRDMAAYEEIFAEAVAIMPFGATLVQDDGVERLAAEWVTSNYFTFLGLQPTLGRNFEPADQADGGGAVAIISHAMWQERFGSDPGVLGETLRINGAPVTIVGVGPNGYSGVLPGFKLDVWLSLSTVRPAMGDYAGRTFDNRGDHWFQVKARLADGVTVPQAQAAMDQLAERLAREFPEYNDGRGITVFSAADVRMHPSVDGQLLPMSASLMGLVGLILLIACSNLANLLLVRGSARSRDISIRLALGASRARVLWHVLTESIVLAVAGGMVGLLLALWATRAFSAADLPLPLPAPVDLRLDWRVFLFTLGLSVVTGILFGLLPGLRISRSDVVASLRDDISAMSLRGGRFNLRNVLVVGQVSISFLILVIAGLFVRNLANSQQVPLGFAADRLASISTNAGYAGYGPAEAGPRLAELRERIAALPGVESAALTGQLPVRGSGGSSTLVVEGYAPASGTDSVEVMRSVAGPRYFETVGVPILYGRTFTDDDIETDANVAIVSEAFARTYYGTPDAVGRRFRGQGSETWIDIVGVAADVQIRDLTEEPTPQFYYAFGPGMGTSAIVVARTAGDPAALLQPMRAALREVDPLLTVSQLQTFDQHLSDALATSRLGASMISGFGLLGLALASLGLYAVVAFAVQRRTTELGIRMALGAGRSNVVRLVVSEVMTIIGAAIVIGLAISWFALPGVASNLYRVSALDPLALLATAAILAATGALAAWLPARRAASVDPVQALRHD